MDIEDDLPEDSGSDGAGGAGADDAGRSSGDGDGFSEQERAELNNKLSRRNRELAKRLKQREAEFEEFKERLAAMEGRSASDDVDDGRDRRREPKQDRSAERSQKRLAEIEAENAKLRRTLFERDFSAAVLRGVPEAKATLAQDVLAGLMARGHIDIDPDDDELDLRTATRQAQTLIKKRHPNMYLDSGPPPSGAGAPDATAAIRNAKHPREIQGSDWDHVSRDQIEAMFGKKKSGSLGM